MYGNLVSYLNGNINLSSLPTIGDAYIEFVYANKNVSIKSSYPEVLNAEDNIKMTINANINLVVGWNQVALVLKDIKTSSTTGRPEMNLEITTLSTSNQKWIYESSRSQSMMNFTKSKTAAFNNSK